MYKSGKIRFVCVAVTLMLLLMSVLSGCGESANLAVSSGTETSSAIVSTEKATELPFVKLSWYAPSAPPTGDTAAIYGKVNDVLKEKINANLEIIWLDWSAYADKIKMMGASGEPFDLFWGMDGFFGFSESLSRNALMPLDDLLDNYGQDVISHVKNKVFSNAFESVMANGKIYAIPNSLVNVKPTVAMDKEIADQYGITDKFKSATGLKDLDPIMAILKEKNVDRTIFAAPILSATNWNESGMKVDKITNYIVYDLSQNKVVHLLQVPQYIENMKLLSDWYKKGYIAKDAATTKPADLSAGVKAKKYLIFQGGIDDAAATLAAGYPCVSASGTQSVLNTAVLRGNFTCFSATSKKSERAMMLLNTAFKEADTELGNSENLFNLLSYGLEDVHYKKTNQVTIDPVPNSGYSIIGSLLCGGSGFANYYNTGWTKEVGEFAAKETSQSEVSPLLGFSFDSEPVKTKLAQVNQVFSDAEPILNTGSVPDFDKYSDELVAKMKKVGLDDVIAEIEKQIEQWKASKGK